MCPNPIRAATVLMFLTTVVVAASPASAWPFGSSTPAAPAAAPAKAPAAPTGPTKADAAARALAEKQDPLTRVAFWSRESKNDPTDAEAGTCLANALRALGRYDEAVDAARKVIAVHPKHAPALFEVARAQISAGQGFYAIEPMKTAAALDPKDWKPWSLLGVAYEQNKQPELAATAYQQALRLSPDNPKVLTNYALFRATHGEPQAAEAMLRKAVGQPGSGAPERQNLALVLGLEGKFGEAEQLIRQDLPPEAADADLAYLHALSPAGAGVQAPATLAPAAMVPTPAAPVARSWGGVQASEAAAAPKQPSR